MKPHIPTLLLLLTAAPLLSQEATAEPGYPTASNA